MFIETEKVIGLLTTSENGAEQMRYVEDLKVAVTDFEPKLHLRFSP